MTPDQIEEMARRRYNSVSDNFWSSDEILQLLYDACMELAIETKCIERIFTTTTVAGTQEYSFPTNVISIKRVEYNGKKLTPITMREDDAITGLNSIVVSQASPQFYWFWNYSIYLRQIPDAAEELKVWAVVQPSAITSLSTLEIPTEFHMKTVNYIVQEMAAKDSNFEAASYYGAKWEKAKMDVKKWMAMRKRGDAFSHVQDEESSIGSYMGIV